MAINLLADSPKKGVNLLAEDSPSQPMEDQAPANEQEDVGSYLDNLPSEEGFFHKLPRNILIGLAKLGHSTLNTPHDLAEMAENRLNDFSNQMQEGLPSSLKKSVDYKNMKFSDQIPKQENYDFAELLGQKGDPTLMDKLLQGSVEHLPEILGGRGLLKAAARRLTGTHQLDTVKKAAQQFGENNFAYSPNVMKEASLYMPNTEATKQLLMDIKAGQYPASFSLRSQLGRHQNNLSNSPLASERLLAPKVSELRQTMLNQLQDALREQGMHVEADMLHKGIKNYAQYMRIKNVVMPIIKRLGVPTSLAAAIGFGYAKGKNIVNQK